MTFTSASFEPFPSIAVIISSTELTEELNLRVQRNAQSDRHDDISLLSGGGLGSIFVWDYFRSRTPAH